MVRQYHCLISGLQELNIDDQKNSSNLYELIELLINSLSDEDYFYIKSYLLRNDNNNLLSFLKDGNTEFELIGNFNKDEIEEFVLKTKDDEIDENDKLMPFWYTFINAFLNDTPLFRRISWENQLTTLYYNHLLKTQNEFIKGWYEFELTVNNILVALNCKKYKIDYDNEIIGSNRFSMLIRNSSAKDFNLTGEFKPIEELIKINEIDDPLQREHAIDQLKWRYLDEHAFFYYFTIEKVFAWFVKFNIAYRWAKADGQIGKEFFKELLETLQNSTEFPKEFIQQKN